MRRPKTRTVVGVRGFCCRRRSCYLGIHFLLSLGPVHAIQLPFLTNQDSHQQDGSGTSDTIRSRAKGNGSSKKPAHETFVNTPPSPTQTGALLASALWEQGSYFLQQHLEMQRQTYQKLHALIMYKPPVGIVTVYCLLELVLSGRIFRVYKSSLTNGNTDEQNGQANHNNGPNNIMQEEYQKPKRRRHRGRAFSLEERDQAYVTSGVMELVRGRLCVAVLSDLVEQQEELHPEFAAERSALFRYKKRSRDKGGKDSNERVFQVPWIYGTALDALQITCPPGGSRLEYADQLREPLSKLRAAKVYGRLTAAKGSVESNGPSMLQVATMILEIRATDAILRACRDRLLKTTYRLARAVKYWSRRVEQTKTISLFQQNLLRNTIEGNRLRLSYAQAAYRAELDRLGRICAMLLIKKQQPHSQESPGRPREMQDIHLLHALQQSTRANTLYRKLGVTPVNGASRQDKRRWRSTWRLPKLSRYTLRIEKGKLILHHLEKDTYIEGASASKVLMEDDQGSLREWYADSVAWVQAAKISLCDVLSETLVTSVSKGDQHSPLIHEVDMIREAWDLSKDAQAKEPNQDPEAEAMAVYNYTLLAWGRVLHIVEDVRESRRVGEGRTISIGELSPVGGLSDFNVFGIPSALLKIYVAYRVHQWITPHWPKILEFLKEAWQTSVIIFMTRFWDPAKEVVLDVLNRGDQRSMLDDFNVALEESGLDTMLKDLKFGDGTPGDRAKALDAAAKQYEEDLRTNLFRTMASGQLVRLLLVQMQQLKVGLLNAMQDIDVLLQANKLNMRLMATIPAIFLVTVGTRMFFRNLYNLRSRDLRPISAVHAEMTEHLYRMKSILLLANVQSFGDASPMVAGHIVAASGLVLGPVEVGEFALKMHCYLVLLDYCSPKPFPNRQCDDLHLSMQEVLGSLKTTRGEPVRHDVERSTALVDLVIKKHQGLQKFL